jgi:predicted transcriptional regulator
MNIFNNLGIRPISKIMHTKVITVMPTYSIKTTIETFRTHRISCAPVASEDGKIIGLISEHDLLIQAASKPMDHFIEYSSKVTAISPETTIKEALILFYKKRLKHTPVIDKNQFIIGMISRIDLLNYLIDNEPEP